MIELFFGKKNYIHLTIAQFNTKVNSVITPVILLKVDKKRIIKKFEQLPDEILALVKRKYPDGYEDSLITFQSPNGELEIGLPLETNDAYYLIKMPKNNLSEEEEDEYDNSESANDDFDNLDNLQIADEIADEEE